MLRPLLLCAALILAAAPGAGQSLPDGFFPEGLARSADGTLYAGSAVAGSIVRVRPGAGAAEPFVAPGAGGLMSVQGLHADDRAGWLYACTGDLGVARTPRTESALLAFSLADGRLMGRWPLPGGGFCNDLTPAPGGGFFVSDTARPRILRFDPDQNQLAVWVEHPLLGGADFNGNGIAVDRGAVYLTTFTDGRLLRVPIRDGGAAGTPETVALPRPLAGADALRVAAPGRLLVFENDIPGGNGRLTLVDLRARPPRLAVVAEGLAEPTSGVIHDGRVIVVESQFRKLFGAEKGRPPAPFALRSVALRLDEARSVPLPGGLDYPNGVAVGSDGTLYVGSITSGRVMMQRPGRPWTMLFPGSAELFASTSLRLDAARGLLWGASPDVLTEGRPARAHRVFALDAKTGAVRHSVVLPDGGFGNDLAVGPDGSVLVTDSRNGRVLRLAPQAARFETVIEDARLRGPANIGVAGIARGQDGRLLLGNFGTGRLYALEGRRLRELALPRPIENPDGMWLGADGALWLTEGAVQSGDGRLLRIAEPFAPGARIIETRLSGLESPVNLTALPDGRMWISEARIRHRLIGDRRLPAPTRFRLVAIDTDGGAP